MTIPTYRLFRRSSVHLLSIESAVLCAVIIVVTWASIAAMPPGVPSPWWPASGISAAYALRLRPSDRRAGFLAIALMLTIANLICGLPPLLSLFLGASSSAGVVVVVAVLTWRTTARPLLTTVPTALRLVVGSALGALVGGFLVASTFALLGGGSFWLLWACSAASHAPAILILAPFAMIPPSRFARSSPLEHVLQVAALGLMSVVVFGPGQDAQITFLLLPLLGWAAFRFSALSVTIELVVLAIGLSLLTWSGRGPFANAAGGDAQYATVLVQVFLIACAMFALLTSAAEYDRRRVTARLSSRDQLLQGGFVQSRVGLMIIDVATATPRVLELNRMLEDLLSHELSPRSSDDDGQQWSGPFASRVSRAVRSNELEFTTEVDLLPGGTIVDILAKAIEGAPWRYTVQVVDSTAVRRIVMAQEASIALAKVTAAENAELTRQKDDFVASASHELRTPITSILGFSEVLTHMDDLPPIVATSVETIHRNAQRLSDLVDGLLVLDTPESAIPNGHSADLLLVTGGALESFTPLATKADVRLVWTGPRESCAVACSPLSMSRIIENLISNSLKYAGADATVTMSYSHNETDMTLTIADDGVGMTPEVLANAFVRFYRAPETGSGYVRGSGLGLALVRAVVDSHGGNISLASQPGLGTTATVTLPLASRLVAVG